MAKSLSINSAVSIEEDWEKFTVILPYLSRSNPLSVAIKSNDVHAATTLIKSGDEGINGTIGDYPWPIHMAVQDNNKDACRLLLRYNCEVNRGDDEGYTPLHLATSDTVAMDILEDLLAAGAGVNELTNMKESPLHLAAHYQAIDKLERLLKEKQLNIHLLDNKGNNALHNLLCHDETEHQDLIKVIKVLMERNIDIDAQNKEGKTALMHSASSQLNICTTFMLKAGANPFLRDYQGNSFLHCLCPEWSAEVPCIDSNMLNALETCVDCQIQPSHLLNVKNLQGNTPFLLIVKFRGKEVVEKCIEYGADVNLQNNLGRSSVFEAVSSMSVDKLTLLFKRGADFNLTDTNGQTILHEFFNIEILKVVLENKGDCLANMKDKNGIAPLHNLIFSDKIEKIDLLIENGANVNIADEFGSTPLHFAAWHCSPTVSQFLESKGADPLVVDIMGRRPSDIVRNLEHQPTCPLFPTLAEIIKKEFVENSLSETDSDEVDIETEDPITEASLISKAVDAENVKVSVTELLNLSAHGIVQWDDEALQIKEAVIRLLENALVKIKNLDSRFAATLLNTGSSSEGTLVSQPNEFDFVCYLDNFSSMCTIRDNHYRQNDGFCQAELKNAENYQMYSEFFESNNVLDSEVVRTRMQQLFRIAFHQGELWKDTRLYLEEVMDLADKPTINVMVRWVGCTYKDLEISIDVVPAIYIAGHWPSLIDTSSLNLMTNDIKSAGCALLLQSPTNFENDSPDNENTFLRISTVPAEVALFRTFPLVVKQSYALAKILLQPDICPPRHFENEISEVNPAGTYISSYMLKTSLLYVLDQNQDLLDMASNCASNDEVFVKKLTRGIFYHLRERTWCGSLVPYFLNSLEYTDIISFEYKTLDNVDENLSRLMDTQKKERSLYFIELILQILDKLVHCDSS